MVKTKNSLNRPKYHETSHFFEAMNIRLRWNRNQVWGDILVPVKNNENGSIFLTMTLYWHIWQTAARKHNGPQMHTLPQQTTWEMNPVRKEIIINYDQHSKVSHYVTYKVNKGCAYRLYWATWYSPSLMPCWTDIVMANQHLFDWFSLIADLRSWN